jgi:hypothetical protein
MRSTRHEIIRMYAEEEIAKQFPTEREWVYNFANASMTENGLFFRTKKKQKKKKKKDDQVTITKLLTRSCFHYIVFTISVRFVSFTQKTNSGITF